MMSVERSYLMNYSATPESYLSYQFGTRLKHFANFGVQMKRISFMLHVVSLDLLKVGSTGRSTNWGNQVYMEHVVLILSVDLKEIDHITYSSPGFVELANVCLATSPCF